MALGKLISFIGIDGAGKSTLVKTVNERLNKSGEKSAVIYAGRGRGNILPIQFFGKIYRKAGGKEANIPRKGYAFEKAGVLHTLSAPIFALDMLLRYFLVIIPKLLNHDYVITDRYSTDILLMNKVSEWMKSFLFRLFPKPTKIFYIYSSINVLHRRKPEHSVQDLKRQKKIFAKIIRITNAEKIKNDSIYESTENIENILRAMQSEH